MKRKNAARNALFTSILSLLLCVSMLVGTTFAWFTDEVVSGNNVIASGTLDVEMYWGESANAITKDASTGAIFDYDLWEPGYTEVRYVKIANVGNLAFQFRLDIVPTMSVAEGEVNLADVIDVYMFDATADVTRETIAAATPVGTLADLMLDADGAAHGYLLPAEGVGSTDVNDAVTAPRGEISYCIVLKMQESAGNEYQNKTVGDGFKVQLLATQYTWENDSFDHNYDLNADYNAVPNATVINQGVKTIRATHGIGGTVTEYETPFTLQFLPPETLEEAQESPYRYWHADYIVKADKAVPADSMALVGYYDAWCSLNDDNWVAMINDGTTINAETEIRLVELLGATVNYEEICRYGNDPDDELPAELEGFLCGAIDLTGANAGTTITVELRLYEVPAQGECANGGGCKHPSTDCEIGEKDYVVAGTYTYTFPAKEASTVEELNAALTSGGTVALADDVTVSATDTGANGYGATGIQMNAGQTLDGNGNSFGVDAWNTWDSAINITSGTIKNVTVNSGMRGIFISHNGTPGKVYLENVIIDGTIYTISCDQGTNSGLEAKKCTFNGWTSYAATLGDVLFTNCTFGEGQGYAFCRPYAPTTFVGCDFAKGYEIDARAAVTFENCTINGVALTAENLATLVTSNTANATIK